MILITGGCSFSECISSDEVLITWPKHLAEKLNYTHIPTGMGSQGNGLISRKLLYNVHRQLKTHKPEELIVGVMWSQPNRWEYYQDVKQPFESNIDGWQYNPVSVVKNSQGGWVITNHHWKHKLSTTYYKSYYNSVYAQLQTLEHILRVQWYLNQQGVRHFMSNITSTVFDHDAMQDAECQHLKEMIDWSRFLPCEGEYEWCRDNTTHAFKPNDKHPTSEMHKDFVDRLIMPWLIKQGYYFDNATDIL